MELYMLIFAWIEKLNLMWPHILVPLTGFLQASSSFDVRDSTGKVCIIANLTVAFSVEYKSNGQKQVMGGISLLVLCILYHVWGLFVSVHYWNFEQIFKLEKLLLQTFPSSSHVASTSPLLLMFPVIEEQAAWNYHNKRCGISVWVPHKSYW